jgi:hypothetical protein
MSRILTVLRRRTRGSPRDERGAILVQAILLVGVLSVIMIALANYAMVGIRSSARTQSMLTASTAARAGLDLAVLQYSTDVWAPCASITPLDVPPTLVDELNADAITLTCAPKGSLDGHPVVIVAAQGAANGSMVTLKADLQVSVDGTGAAILSFSRE